MFDPDHRRGGGGQGHGRRGKSADDGAARLLVVARDAGERAWAAALAADLGWHVATVERIETLVEERLRDVDAVLLLPGRAAVPPEVALSRVQSLASGRAVVLGLPETGGTPACLGGFGPGCVAVRSPLAALELRRALGRAMAGAAAVRAWDALSVPLSARSGLQAALALAGPDGHPGWFLEALVAGCRPTVSAGAILTPHGGEFRPVAVRGIREDLVLRLARRHAPPVEPEGTVSRVRMGRILRSPASQLRALRSWWWLGGPACGGAGSRTVLFQVRGAPVSPWVDGALDVVARSLLAELENAPLDLETGLELADARTLAERALAVAVHSRRGGEGPGGAAVVLLSLSNLHDVRREHGPRAEARVLAAAIGRIRRGQRATDQLLRLGPERLALVVPARGPRDAERLADRLLARFQDGSLLRRRGEDERGGDEPLELEVRALHADGSEDPDRLAVRLEELGVPGR